MDKGLKNISGLASPSLYAVGGIWRSFARVDMEEHHYPLHVLQQYTIPRGRALRLCKVLAGLSKESVRKIKVVSKRRAESLPYGAVVLERLLLAGDIKDVVISAYGLREGLFYALLPPEERAKDPLLEFARGSNERLSRVPQHAREMFDWTPPLFEGESLELRRIREASAYFSDIGWRRHPDNRAVRRLQPGADRAFLRRRSPGPRPDRHVHLPSLFRRRGFSPRPGAGRAAGQG